MVVVSNTVPYALLLMLIGIASHHKLLVLLALLFVIGSYTTTKLGYDENVAIFIGLGLCAVVIGVASNTNHINLEHFQQSSAYTTEQNPGEAPTKECSVYYVPAQYHDVCDKGFFSKSTLQLQARLKELNANKKSLTAEEATEKDDINKTLQARREFDVPGDGHNCKVGIPGMKSQVTFDYTDKRTIYSRNDKDSQGKDTESSKNWAHCWMPAANTNDAVAYANNFGTRGQIVAKQNKSVVFSNSPSHYAQATFNTLGYNDVLTSVCSAERPSIQPTQDVFIGFDIDARKTIKAYNAYSIKDNDLVRFNKLSEVNNTNDVYALLFEFATEDRTIFFQPKVQPFVQMVNITLNMCGGIQSIERNLSDFSLTALGITKQYVARIPDGIEFNGDVASIDSQYNRILQDMLTMKNKISEIDTQEQNYTPSYMPGIQVYRYDVISPTLPSMNTLEQVDSFYKTSVINKTLYKVPDPHFSTYNGQFERKAWEFIGYIDIPTSGYYRFKLKSDDAGDVFIGETTPNTTEGKRANVLVATHYGYHGVDDSGISLAGPDGRGFYYNAGPQKMYGRVMEWGGWEGFMLYWKTETTDWTLIPTDKFQQHNDRDTPNYQSLKDSLKQQTTSLSMMLERLTQFKSIITSSTRDRVIGLMRGCIGRELNVSVDNISAYDRVYLFAGNPAINTRVNVGPSTKQILIKDVVDLSRSYRTINSPYEVKLNTTPVYSISFWLNVATPEAQWRSILYFGESEDWSDTSKVDRTPALFIYPSNTQEHKDRVLVHIRHRVNTLGKDPNSVNYGLDIADNAIAPRYGEWFHVAYTIKKSVIKVYLNGNLVNSVDFKSIDPTYEFEWNLKNKKFYVGMTPTHNWSISPITAPVYLQKLYWYNSELQPTIIKQLSQEAITPAPPPITGSTVPLSPLSPQPHATLQSLFDNSTVDGPQNLKIGKFVYQVFVIVTGYGKWLKILNYCHKGGTNPILLVRKPVDGFPMHRDELGADGSQQVDTWGHVGPALLDALYTQCGGFTKVLFYARSSKGNILHFKTSDINVVNYIRTGVGSVGGQMKQYELLSNHNTSIPQDAPDNFTNQGDYALTEFPFWKGATSHWGIRGLGYRWEVGDYADNFANDTVHHVYIGI